MSNRKLSELARAFRRNKLPVVQKRRSTGDIQQNQIDLDPPPIHGGALDSWEQRYRPEAKAEKKLQARGTPTTEVPTPKVPEIQSSTQDAPEGFEVKPALRLTKSKKRKKSLGISCSDEEAALLRKAASDRNMSFSEWARNTLFRAMGRKPPARPKKDY